MAALRSRYGHYIFILWFLFLLSFFFPGLISAVADCLSTILPRFSANLGCRSETCCTRLAENTGRKKSSKIRRLCFNVDFHWLTSLGPTEFGFSRKVRWARGWSLLTSIALLSLFGHHLYSPAFRCSLLRLWNQLRDLFHQLHPNRYILFWLISHVSFRYFPSSHHSHRSINHSLILSILA